jgi:hypothetical protein
LNDLNQFEFDFKLNLTATRNCSRGPPISALASLASHDHALPTHAIWLLADAGHPALAHRGAGPPCCPQPLPAAWPPPIARPPFPLLPPTAPLKGCCHRCYAPFLSLPRPHPFSSETEPPPHPPSLLSTPATSAIAIPLGNRRRRHSFNPS